MGVLNIPELLPLDLTGTATSNLIAEEPYTLETVGSSTNRILLLRRGSFYKQGLLVRQSNGIPLVYGDHYRFGHHEAEYSKLTGKDIEGFIVITDPTIDDELIVTYQALGGDRRISYESLRELLDVVRDTELTHDFKDIVGAPEGYPGDISHLHKYWQVYGFESLIENLNILGTALGDNRTGLKSASYEYSNIYISLLNDIIVHYRSFMSHLTDYNNPHQNTVEQLGLENLKNWRLSNYSESADVTVTNLYMPMSGAVSIMEEHLLPLLNNHVRDKNNPHNVTLDQLDLYSEAQIRDLYAARLLRSVGAVDSKLLEGKTLNRLISDTKTNLDTTNIDPNSLFNRLRIAANPSTTSDMILTGDNTFKHLREIVSRPDLESGWVFLPGLAGSRAAAWNSVVAANVPAHRVMLKSYQVGRALDTLVARRNPNGTTTAIFN